MFSDRAFKLMDALYTATATTGLNLELNLRDDGTCDIHIQEYGTTNEYLGKTHSLEIALEAALDYMGVSYE